MAAATHVFLEVHVGGVQQFVNMTYCSRLIPLADGGVSIRLADGEEFTIDEDFQKLTAALGRATSNPKPGPQIYKP